MYTNSIFPFNRNLITPRPQNKSFFWAVDKSTKRFVTWLDSCQDLGLKYYFDKEKMLKASSRETIRSRSRTGKHSRQLRSQWTDAWEADGAPQPLPMPLQSQVTEAPLARVTKLAEVGHEGANQLVTSWIGQGVGLMNTTQSAKTIVYEFMQDYLEASERLSSSLQD